MRDSQHMGGANAGEISPGSADTLGYELAVGDQTGNKCDQGTVRGGGEMAVFLKLVKQYGLYCNASEKLKCRLLHERGCLRVDCSKGVFIETPRPPDGTRCRDLDGNIKVVGVDV